MKLSKLFMAIGAVAALSFHAQAAISVGPGGAGPLTFNTTPAATEFSTGVLVGTGPTFVDGAGIDAAVAGVNAVDIVRTLPTSGTVPPSTFSGGMRHNTAATGLFLQSRPTTDGTNAAGMMLATLQNDTGAALSSFGVDYDFNSFNVAAGEAPGFQVYFSPDGTPGSWQKLAALSGIETIGLHSDTVTASIASGALFYLLWVDDNANGITDPSYTIDNLSITLPGPVVRITRPGNGANIAFGTPITIDADAQMFPGTITSVQFFENGNSVGSDPSSPYSVVFNGASLGNHDLTAIASDNLGNSRTSSVVRITINPNNGAAVAITTPTADELIVASNVVLFATASDTDGSVTQVQFRDGNTPIGAPDTTAPYTINHQPVAAGVHTFTAVATDNLGLLSTSAPVKITIVQPLNSLIPFGAIWKYLDDGSDQGNQWFLVDDTLWASGAAELGYGDNDEVTTVSFGANANDKHITTYFKHHFNVANPASITNLAIRLRHDDGAIVYLNGNFLFSVYMTNDFNEINYRTLATNAIDDDLVFGILLGVGTDIGQLPSGDNVVAVEIHQATTNSSDISFDLELIANVGANPPVVSLLTPTNSQAFVAPDPITVSAVAMDRDGGVMSVDFYVDDTLVLTDLAPPYAGTGASTAGIHVISAVATDNTGLTSTSSVTITVVGGPVLTTLVNSNANWTYLDDGSDQLSAWHSDPFDDSLWKSGNAQFGYGETDEATVLLVTNAAGVTSITFYFRKDFTVTDLSSATGLVLRVKRDDGAIVYLNGTEVWRDNMPAGAVTFQTPANGAVADDGQTFQSANIPQSALVLGQNLITVEIHQAPLPSSDVSFDLQLQTVAPPSGSGPRLTITLASPTSITLSWTPNTPGFRLVQSGSVLGPWVASPNPLLNPQTVTPIPGVRFYKLINP